MKLMKYAAAALMFALPVQGMAQGAKGVVYECDITKKSERGNAIGDKMAFVLLENGSVQAIDQHVLFFMGGPIQARVRKKQGNVLDLSWHLEGARSRNKQPIAPIRYRATLNQTTKALTVRVSSTVYSGARVRGSGTCVVRTDAKLPKILR